MSNESESDFCCAVRLVDEEVVCLRFLAKVGFSLSVSVSETDVKKQRSRRRWANRLAKTSLHLGPFWTRVHVDEGRHQGRIALACVSWAPSPWRGHSCVVLVVAPDGLMLGPSSLVGDLSCVGFVFRRRSHGVCREGFEQ